MRAYRSSCWAALAAVVFLSCGDDDNSTNPGTDSPEGQAAVQVVALVGAAAEQISLGSYAQFLPAPGKPGPTQCMPLTNLCDSGSAQFCPGGNGGFVEFTACNVDGHTVNGTASFIGTAASGTATMEINVDGVGILVSIQYFVNTETMCINETLNPIAVSSSEGSLSGIGSFEYCSGSTIPASGTLSGTVQRNGVTYQFAFGIDPEGDPGDFFLQIFTVTGEPLLNCDGNLIDRSVGCDPADE